MIAAVIASLALAWGTPAVHVSCVSGATFDTSVGAPLTSRWWPGGQAGAFFYITRNLELTQQVCDNLAALRSGYTWQRGYAAFTVAHELGHAADRYAEEDADCYGAGRASAVAFAFGMRGRAAFAALARNGVRDWGYNPIPATCWKG